jgi:hypothetical protein
MTLPSGEPAGDTTDQVDVGINYLYSWELSENWSLAGSTGFDTASEMNDEYVIWHQSVAVGVSLSEQWGAYCEYYGFYTYARAVDAPEHFINGGITYLVNNNLQLDWRVGTGLNDNSEDLFAGAGLSVRL